jgi:hypothetical protein
VDAQSGSICLSPGWRREPNAYANRITERYSDADSFSHSYRNRKRKRNSDAHCNSYTFWKADADSKASSDTKALTITRTSGPALQDRRRRASGS